MKNSNSFTIFSVFFIFTWLHKSIIALLPLGESVWVCVCEISIYFILCTIWYFFMRTYLNVRKNSIFMHVWHECICFTFDEKISFKSCHYSLFFLLHVSGINFLAKSSSGCDIFHYTIKYDITSKHHLSSKSIIFLREQILSYLSSCFLSFQFMFDISGCWIACGKLIDKFSLLLEIWFSFIILNTLCTWSIEIDLHILNWHFNKI